ncbi:MULTISPECIES: aldehyde dehydrogenase family protein [Pseudomonas syringae group]|uniref:Aldehyde dehydrogenase n=4 Tax=Pseudomonas syringae group TaxID=136849 RepID=F3GCE8_PSESJ|nr:MULTISPECIES: aldehyde dehydrogenase family protein [Pseudomonas syringae group]EGH44748.1 aldehyde dehydrogenase [Pseudomonas syringae pv. pisi str. 1704B]RMU79391.1 Aldehyde dehydrogenase [Pseudomonas syringae pv. aptata]AZG85703.1 aldehyde dehydrogenase family protein [Pseudomonas syringae pv. pisi str. PP1]PYD09209.1 aldehyde dehydrogenase [Pseudomonas syringae pv. pisi]PYD25615.1 aldehyde dehydrogenase [Pseudomonas syringae pv. pisi]
MNSLSMAKPAYEQIKVFNPFDGSVIGEVLKVPATSAQRIIDGAQHGASVARQLSRAERSRILEQASALVEKDKDAFAHLISAESGKTIRQARKEVLRCVNTLKLSAEEAKRNAGEVIPFDSYAGSESRQGWFTREPLGIILAITPYNDPLNLVAHKLGPAIAGGNSVILKPSELTPLSAMKLVSYLMKAGLPADVVSVATGDAELGKALVAHRAVRMISFTGGFATGEQITKTAGLKKMAMDLGGNAPVIVMGDCELESAVESCVSGAYWAAGQNCIGTQRILIDTKIYTEFVDKFVKNSGALVVGNQADEATDVGPMISEAAAKRAEDTVREAVEKGAKILLGNQRQGTLFYPTILVNVSSPCRIWQEEVFSPIVILQEVSSLEEALALANEPEYSLHAGIFTSNLNTAMKAAKQLEAGGVMINDSSDYRFDAMPFGGFKYGSMGREGVRFAFEEMTQPKVVCLNGPGI